MSSEIGPLARDFTLIPRSLKEAQEIGDLIAKSGFAPKGYAGKPADVIIGIQMGLDVGLSPMQALQSIAVINGKPSIYGDAAIGLVYRSGALEYIDAPEPTGPFDDALTAVVKIKRKGQAEVVRTFSVADAKRAKLWGKEGPWSNYPRRMMLMRARAFAIRDTFADVLLGLGIAEESQDIEAQAPQVEVIPMPRALEAPAAVAVTPPEVEPIVEPMPAPAPVVPTPAPVEAPAPPANPERDAAIAKLPKYAASTSENSYLGKAAHTITEVFQPVAGHPFWGIRTAAGLLAHTHDEKVAASLKELVNTDHEVIFSGVLVEHPRAPLQVHGFVLAPTPAPPAQPPADALRF